MNSNDMEQQHSRRNQPQCATGSSGSSISGAGGALSSGINRRASANYVNNNQTLQGGINNNEEEEEEMSVTERELAEDAAWKRIQQNTFTR